METKNENQEIPKWFENHPLAAAFKQEQEAKTLKHRQEAAERLEAIKTEIAEGFPEQEAALSSILHDLKAAEKRLAGLKSEAGQAYRDLQISKAALDRKKQTVETELYSTYDERIDEARDFFQNKLDSLRRPETLNTIPRGSTRNLFTMKKTVRLESNHLAVAEAMQYCRDAITTLEDLKLCPEFPEAAVESLKEGIPTTDRYQEFEGERSLPRDPPLDAGCPSDYEIESLLQKADKMIRRRR